MGEKKAKMMMEKMNSKKKRRNKVRVVEKGASGRGYFASNGQNVLLERLHLGVSGAIQKPPPW